MHILDVVGIGETRRNLRERLRDFGFEVTEAPRLSALDATCETYDLAVLDDRIDVERAVRLLRNGPRAGTIVILFRGRSIEIRRRLDFGGERPIYIHKGNVEHILRVLGLSLLVREGTMERPIDPRVLRMVAEAGTEIEPAELSPVFA